VVYVTKEEETCGTIISYLALICRDAKNWRRPPGRPRTTWMKTIQKDLKSNNLSLNEAIDVAQN